MTNMKARSNIKWATAMMLPEHVKLLRGHRQDLNKQEKPILDEQEWEEIGRRLLEAYNSKEEITLEYFKNGYILEVTGKVHAISNSSVKVGGEFVDKEEIVSVQ